MKLELVEQFKLLGVVITSDLKWDENTDYITKKAFSRLWLLRRLKKLGASRKALLDIYMLRAKNGNTVPKKATTVQAVCCESQQTPPAQRVVCAQQHKYSDKASKNQF